MSFFKKIFHSFQSSWDMNKKQHLLEQGIVADGISFNLAEKLPFLFQPNIFNSLVIIIALLSTIKNSEWQKHLQQNAEELVVGQTATKVFP